MRYDDSLMNEAIRIGIRMLETVFLGGLAGSLILIVVTSVEDVATVLGRTQNENTAKTGEQV